MKQKTKNRLFFGLIAALGAVAVLEAAIIAELIRRQGNGGGQGLFSYVRGLFHPSRSAGHYISSREPAAAGGDALVIGGDIRQIHEEISSVLERMLSEVHFAPDAGGALPGGRAFGQAPAARPGMSQLQEQIDEIFRQSFRMMRAGDIDGILGRGWERISGSSAMDVRDRGGHYELTMHLPGLDRDDIYIQVDGRLLTVGAAGKPDAGPGGRGTMDFRTRVMMPEPVSIDKIEASFENGVLRVKAPKAGGRAPNKIVVM